MNRLHNIDKTMGITTVNTVETALVQLLIEQGGYTKGNAPDYCPELGMFRYEVIKFQQESQPKRWEKISVIHCAVTKKSKTEKPIELLTEYRTAFISEVVTGNVKVI